jgi:hypothetical protein
MSPHAYTYPTVIELRRVGAWTDGRELGARAVQSQTVRPSPVPSPRQQPAQPAGRR